MINYKRLYELMAESRLHLWAEHLPEKINRVLRPDKHGDLERWLQVLEELPEITPSSFDLRTESMRVGQKSDCDDKTHEKLERQLRKLHPWRKGPFEIFGISIETEWRSDWKWDRLKDHVQPLAGKTVLDVGCGNGYHCWRMAGEGAELVLGVDPYILFVMQFFTVKKFLPHRNVHVLPLGFEDVPQNLQAFDTVFSMGVLHHRRSPIDHLLELKSALRPGGELVLETLVIEEKEGQTLVPQGRYASMRNVWFLPSPPTLVAWMERCGYKNIRVIDVTKTTVEEQRSTDWMTFHSLPDFLDPENSDLTIEGHPAPVRAIILANKP